MPTPPAHKQGPGREDHWREDLAVRTAVRPVGPLRCGVFAAGLASEAPAAREEGRAVPVSLLPVGEGVVCRRGGTCQFERYIPDRWRAPQKEVDGVEGPLQRAGTRVFRISNAADSALNYSTRSVGGD